MKKWLAVLLVAFVATQSGCASVQKKFTRKKKEPKRVSAVIPLEEGAYQKPYSNDYYYKTHYTYWQTWHDELLTQLGGNSKKVARCAQEALTNLSALSGYLAEEKRVQLQPHLDALSKISSRLSARSVASSEEGGVRVELQKIRRIVAAEFDYSSAKPYLTPDKVDLGENPDEA